MVEFLRVPYKLEGLLFFGLAMLLISLQIRLYLKVAHTPMHMFMFLTPHSSQDVPRNASIILYTIIGDGLSSDYHEDGSCQVYYDDVLVH